MTSVPAQSSPGALGPWWRQGARSAFLLTPAWSGLKTTPVIVASLIAVPYLISILLERLYIAGAATFYWPAFHTGWLFTALALWICWIALPASSVSPGEPKAPSATALFSMLAAQVLTMQALLGFVYVPVARMGLFSQEALGFWGWWAVWLLPLAWLIGAQSKLIWQSSTQRRLVRFAACIVLAGVAVFSQWSRPLTFWYPARAETAEAPFERFELTQQILEQQPKLLAEQLQALVPQRSGVVDVYTITYAPYADQDVFQRESAMVADVMENRFDAQGRTIQLVNHRRTAGQLAWATPLNLQRTIEKMASLMDRDEDILLIHLASHGARNGTLSTRHWPLTIDELTPEVLRGWLDAAHIRFRIVSVSACYSGSWIAPIATEGTLVITAADADHTSLGCGNGSQLTYFGRAMFDEQLRRTWSFEEAHASARIAIDERERAAAKSDGFSNPQIRVGSDIRPQLTRLATERAGQASR